MYNDHLNRPDENSQTKIDKVKAFLWAYETPIACAATGVVAFTLGRKIYGPKLGEHVTQLTNAIDSLHVDLDRAEHDLLIMDEFIEVKNLGKQFKTFYEKQQRLAV